LANARDTDVFHFAVKKGERLKFKSGTRSLGSPCDLVLTLRAEDGSQAAQSDLSSANDAVVTHTFSTEGNYVLEVRELSGTAPTNVPYRVTIEQSAASVELSTEENVVAIKRAETAKLKITAQRSDYDGPVNISLSNPADGIVLENNEIPEKKNEVEVTIKADPQLPAGRFQQLTLVGNTTNQNPVTVSTRPALRKAFPLMLNPPKVLDGTVTVVVVEK
jgi:hypothetical protein